MIIMGVNFHPEFQQTAWVDILGFLQLAEYSIFVP
jgi:hypothetical protein